MNGTPAIAVEDMTVAYGERPALWDVDLTVPSGTLAAIVGPNGAGKSTLIQAILGLVRPAGRVARLRPPYAEQRRLVGYVPQRGRSTGTSRRASSTSSPMGRYGSLGWSGVPAAASATRRCGRSEQVGMERARRPPDQPALRRAAAACSSPGRSSRTRTST